MTGETFGGARPFGGSAGARRGGRSSRLPSPIFLGLVAVTALTGWALWTGTGPAGLMVFLFVAAGWLVSLCLHEFAHAVVAFVGGDRSVAEKGYLTLDPLRYTNVALSLILPLIFVLLGGIGLPGGAVYVNRAALRSKAFESAVSAAGPLTNLVQAVVLAIPLASVGRDDLVGRLDFWAAVGFLAFLQVTAAVLNALPVPGLDGFGVIEPFLSPATKRKVAPVAPYAIFLVFLVLWIPVVNRLFFSAVLAVLGALGVPDGLAGYGSDLFQFWLR